MELVPPLNPSKVSIPKLSLKSWFLASWSQITIIGSVAASMTMMVDMSSGPSHRVICMGPVFRLCLVTKVNTALAFLPLLTHWSSWAKWLLLLVKLSSTGRFASSSVVVLYNVSLFQIKRITNFWYIYFFKLLFHWTSDIVVGITMTMIHQAKTKQRSTGLFCFSSRLRLCLSSSCILGSRSRGGCWQDQDQTHHLQSEARRLQTTQRKNVWLPQYFCYALWKLGWKSCWQPIELSGVKLLYSLKWYCNTFFTNACFRLVTL